MISLSDKEFADFKKTSPAEDLIDLVALMPWWAGVLLAIYTCLGSGDLGLARVVCGRTRRDCRRSAPAPDPFTLCRVAREAAARHLLVDFHGAYKPTGLYRTWPNVVTSEGVLGLEQSKWGPAASPDNAVTFPFMRMLAGPVDYTPGAMLNATKADFRPVFNRPMSQGTRAHQLSMYGVFESPLQMLADSPSNYRKEPDSLAFLYNQRNGRLWPPFFELVPENIGSDEPLAWQLAQDGAWFEASPATGTTPAAFRIVPTAFDTSALGTYTGAVTVTVVDPPGTAGSPQTTSLRLDVVDRPVFYTFVPLVRR